MIATTSARSRAALRLLSGFLGGQALVQLLGLATGFALIRWMDVADYAAFTVAFTFTAALANVVDSGVSGSIFALVGGDQDDPAVVGRYIAAGRSLRRQAILILAPAAAIVFGVLCAASDIGWALGTALYFTTLVSVFARATTDFYSTPLEMARDFRGAYALTIAASLGRLATTVACYLAGVLTGFVAALTAALTQAAIGRGLVALARHRIAEPDEADGEARAAIIHYVKPGVLVALVLAFQSQLVVGLAAFFGTTSTIAQVGALARLGQLFAVASALNPSIVLPYIAKQPLATLWSRVRLVCWLSLAFGTAATAIAFAFPGIFVMLLGEAYADVRPAVGWSVLAASIGFVTATVATVNAARRYIFWWSTVVGLGATLLVQVIGVAVLDVSDLVRLQQLVVLGNGTNLVVCLATTAWGALRGERRLPPGAGSANELELPD